MPDVDRLFKTFSRYLPSCTNEEELREMFSLRILPHLGVSDSAITSIRHEYSILAGRLDSLYGSAILEFKAPGVLPQHDSHPSFVKIQQRMASYIKEVSKKNNLPVNTIIGIIFDGKRLAYQFSSAGQPIVYGPYALTETLFKTLLDRLVYGLTIPKALSQANLIRDFGLESTRCAPFIRALYFRLVQSKQPRTEVLYQQWKIYFREICGYDFVATKNLRRITSVHYGIGDPDIAALTFAVHTYFSIILTLFALRIGRSLSDDFDPNFWLGQISKKKHGALRKILHSATSGNPFQEVGLNNLLESTFFEWYIDDMDDEIEGFARDAASTFNEYSTETLRLRDIGESDILKDLYQSLSPAALRHALGEYYTPDWLADLVLDRAGYSGDTKSRILDPTCGSGTFLVKAIQRIIASDHRMSDRNLVKKILNLVRGIDLNPLAVTASKINYLIAIGERLLKSCADESIEIPVYLSDAMLAPLEHKYETGDKYVIPTKVANFTLAKALVEDERFLVSMTLVQSSLKLGWSFEELKAALVGTCSWTHDEAVHYFRELFVVLEGLEEKGLDGIWAGIIKNFFAPSFLSQVDFLVGNPPWVNWENLPESYRESIKKYWSVYAYNLFRHKGLAARLGSAHDDICVLLTYIVADVFLKGDGTLAFVLPQTLFKSKGGGEGFRSFEISNLFKLRVVGVDDLNDVNAFDAANKPAIFVARKGEGTTYPVPYRRWTRPAGVKVTAQHSLKSVLAVCDVIDEIALPIDKDNIASPWLTGSSKLVEALRQVIGKSGYRARKGVDTSLNAVFWVREIDRRPGEVLVENCQTRSRSEVRKRKLWIEEEALFPLLRGADFGRWKAELTLKQVLLYDTTTGRPFSSDLAASKMNKAWRYFKTPDYVELLKERGIYKKHLSGLPHYACFDIGPYSFSKIKVVWKALASGMQAMVLQGDASTIIVPDHNVLMIPIKEIDEAHYLCAVLNSDVATTFVNAYVEWFFSAHILDFFKIPQFNRKIALHMQLSNSSRKAHLAAKRNDKIEVADLEKKINQLVRKLPSFENIA